jgi:RNase P protein component
MSKIETQEQAVYAEQAAERALAFLLQAREELVDAHAPKTLERVRLAISSAKGAVRNAHARVTRAYYAERRAEEQPDREYLLIDRSKT